MNLTNTLQPQPNLKKERFKTSVALVTFLGIVFVWTVGYAVGHIQGQKKGQVDTMKAVTKIMIDVGHKMATNGIAR